MIFQQVSNSPALAASEAREPPSIARGSRRRRLWELGGHAHCPIVGVCLPITALRRLIDKALDGRALADDYELHCGAVAECKLRTAVAERLQRELDRRCLLALRQAAKAKTAEALASWWRDAAQGRDLAGALWATLSHPRCTDALEHQVLGEVHMRQHQVGIAQRVDLQRFEAAIDENAVLARELGAAQQRSTRQAEEHTRRSEQQQSQIVQLRAQLIGRDTCIAGLRDDLRALEAAAPGLKSRVELARENQQQLERLRQLQLALQLSRDEAELQRRRVGELTIEIQRIETASDEPPLHEPAISTEVAESTDSDAPARLDDRAVLCVGGRPASVPVYRRLIERIGGRFLHHDGGDEDSVARLDSTLAAADLVICQTGCVSHDAYWRVKDHCKRTGKRCVFVESPSTAGLKRALLALGDAASCPARQT